MMIHMRGLRVILVNMRISILISSNICYNKSQIAVFFKKEKKNDFSCILHEIQEVAKLHCSSLQSHSTL